MNDMSAPIAAQDAAWAAINTPLSCEELLDFCQDVERLLRINPMLEFSSWEKLSNNSYHLKAKNISQTPAFEVDTTLQLEHQEDGLTIHYTGGLKSRTVIKIEPSGQGSKLTITDDYSGLSEDAREQRLGEVDRSLVTWAEYLQRFLIMWKRWSRFGLWRWYMRRIWQPMKPSGRRITYMFWWITLVEIALIALGAAIYWAEYA